MSLCIEENDEFSLFQTEVDYSEDEQNAGKEKQRIRHIK